MKKIKLLRTCFAVIAIVGSAMAVKADFFGQGSVYCGITPNHCCINRVDFRVNSSGSFTRPCGSTSGVENVSFICDETGNCIQNTLGLKYDAVPAGK